MGVRGEAVHQHIPRRLEDLLYENAEDMAGILRMFMPPREAERVARDIARREAQEVVANGRRPAAPGPDARQRAHQRRAEAERGRRPVAPRPNAPAAPPPPVQNQAAAPQAAPEGYAEAKLRQERAQQQLAAAEAAAAQRFAMRPVNGRNAEQVYREDQAGMRGIPRYVPDPELVRMANAPLPPQNPQPAAAPPPNAQQAPPNIPNAPAEGPAPNFYVGPDGQIHMGAPNPNAVPPRPFINPQEEVKEREEKHGDENIRMAQAQAGARPQNRPNDGRYPEPPNRLAPIPAEINRAGDLTQAGLGRIEDYLRRAERQGAAGAEEFPRRAQDYMNPYNQQVVDKIREEGLRTLNEGVLPSLEAQFIRRGAHGGSRHAGLAARAARDAQGEILARQAQALHTGYGQAGNLFGNDQLRKLQHGQDIRQIGMQQQGSNLADITSLMDIGRYKQSHAQHGKENEYYNFMRKRNEPMELLERQAAMLKGMPAPISQYGYASSPANPQLNMPAQVGSAAAQLLGMTMRRARGGSIRRRRGGRVR